MSRVVVKSSEFELNADVFDGKITRGTVTVNGVTKSGTFNESGQLHGDGYLKMYEPDLKIIDDTDSDYEIDPSRNVKVMKPVYKNADNRYGYSRKKFVGTFINGEFIRGSICVAGKLLSAGVYKTINGRLCLNSGNLFKQNSVLTGKFDPWQNLLEGYIEYSDGTLFKGIYKNNIMYAGDVVNNKYKFAAKYHLEYDRDLNIDVFKYCTVKFNEDPTLLPPYLLTIYLCRGPLCVSISKIYDNFKLMKENIARYLLMNEDKLLLNYDGWYKEAFIAMMSNLKTPAVLDNVNIPAPLSIDLFNLYYHSHD